MASLKGPFEAQFLCGKSLENKWHRSYHPLSKCSLLWSLLDSKSRLYGEVLKHACQHTLVTRMSFPPFCLFALLWNVVLLQCSTSNNIFSGAVNPLLYISKVICSCWLNITGMNDIPRANEHEFIYNLFQEAKEIWSTAGITTNCSSNVSWTYWNTLPKAEPEIS